jgi:hypothetical protein
MGRKYVTTDIVDPVKAPFTKRSFTHLNTALNEPAAAIVNGLIGSYTTNDIIILYGCVIVVTGTIPGTGTATLSAGAVYYNGEIYYVDANPSLSTTSPQTLIWQIASDYISGDPATFSDGTNHDFHEINKFELVAGTAGSGLGNYDAATVKIKFNKAIIPIGTWDMDTSATKGVSLTGTIFDGKNYVAKIKDIRAYIFRDGQPTTVNPQGIPLTSVLTVDMTPQGGVEALDTINGVGTEIVLVRKASGHFDSANYNDSVTNRGYLLIEYGDI